MNPELQAAIELAVGNWKEKERTLYIVGMCDLCNILAAGGHLTYANRWDAYTGMYTTKVTAGKLVFYHMHTHVFAT